MSYDYGPLQTFEVTWMSGHVERVQAHQFSVANQRSLFGGFGAETKTDSDERMEFRGEFDGHWRLVLTARASDIRTVRNVTAGEVIA